MTIDRRPIAEAELSDVHCKATQYVQWALDLTKAAYGHSLDGHTHRWPSFANCVPMTIYRYEAIMYLVGCDKGGCCGWLYGGFKPIGRLIF